MSLHSKRRKGENDLLWSVIETHGVILFTNMQEIFFSNFIDRIDTLLDAVVEILEVHISVFLMINP